MINPLKYLFSKKDIVNKGTKIERKLPLTEVYTFKTGEKLYTYRQSDYGFISSRYWRGINERLNYITMYSLDKDNWLAFVDVIEQRQLEIMNGGDPIKLAADTYAALQQHKANPMNKTSVQLKMHEVLFCMFFLLEEEIEGGYNEAMNQKKMDLLNNDEEAKDNFFFHVDQILTNLQISYEVDMQKMIQEILTLANLNQ